MRAFGVDIASLAACRCTSVKINDLTLQITLPAQYPLARATIDAGDDERIALFVAEEFRAKHSPKHPLLLSNLLVALKAHIEKPAKAVVNNDNDESNNDNDNDNNNDDDDNNNNDNNNSDSYLEYDRTQERLAFWRALVDSSAAPTPPNKELSLDECVELVCTLLLDADDALVRRAARDAAALAVANTGEEFGGALIVSAFMRFQHNKLFVFVVFVVVFVLLFHVFLCFFFSVFRTCTGRRVGASTRSRAQRRVDAKFVDDPVQCGRLFVVEFVVRKFFRFHR